MHQWMIKTVVLNPGCTLKSPGNFSNIPLPYVSVGQG